MKKSNYNPFSHSPQSKEKRTPWTFQGKQKSRGGDISRQTPLPNLKSTLKSTLKPPPNPIPTPKSKVLIRGKVSNGVIDPQPSLPVDFSIDLVYCWVDGSDEEWLATKAKFDKSIQDLPVNSIHPRRWKDWDMLRYSIESANLYAPWIRKIFVIADYQRPYWYDESNPGKVEFVDHPVLFHDVADHLPVFNSLSLESHLHSIPGLSEHFIYANDDTFFGAPVQPEQFFTGDGKALILLTTNPLLTESNLQKELLKLQGSSAPPPPKPSRNFPTSSTPPIAINAETLNRYSITAYDTAQIQVNNALDQMGFYDVPRFRLKHQMKPLRRSWFEFMWNEPVLQPYVFCTSLSRFGTYKDVCSTTLASLIGLKRNEALGSDIDSKFLTISDTAANVQKLFMYLKTVTPKPALYCINDATTDPSDQVRNTVTVGLQTCLPHRL